MLFFKQSKNISHALIFNIYFIFIICILIYILFNMYACMYVCVYK